MRLLCIANPSAYERATTDVPLSYARLAAHEEIELFHADTKAMMQPGRMINAVQVSPGFDPSDFGRLSERRATAMPAGAFDLAFCRTLKPFPAGYLARLVEWSREMRFVNDPAGIQRQLELTFLLDAASAFIPPSLVTKSRVEAEQFLARHGTIVAKRANSCGGRGVYKISGNGDSGFASDNVVEGPRIFEDFPSLYRHLTRDESESVLLVRYLRRVIEGDKRIVVVDGQIYGAYVRRSVEGHWVQNVSHGARCEPAVVSKDERAALGSTCPHYREAGIHLLGYDLLQDDDGKWTISEINAGNIGGLFRLEDLGVKGVRDRFVNWLLSFAERIRPQPRH